MTKKYNTPMLQFVSIKNDIITGSNDVQATISGTPVNSYLAPDRFFEDWDAGY